MKPTMRLWHQSMAPLGEFGAYGDVLGKHLAAVLPEGVAVDVHGSRPGSYLGAAPAEVLRYPVLKHLIQGQIFDHCLAAERAGYDGVVLASFSEPFLPEVRSLVDIPVASMPESALAVGCSCAVKVALVTLTPRSVPRVATLVDNHGLRSRVAGVFPLDPPITEADLVAVLNGDAEATSILESFARSSRQAVAAGADLVIPAEGALNEILWSHGVREIDGATVLDGLAVVVHYAVMMVHLQRTTALGAARTVSYPRPEPALIDAALQRARADYHSPTEDGETEW